MAKLCLLTSLIVLYAYLSEFFLAWYSGEEIERTAFWNRLFGTYWWATWTMLVCNGFVPIMLWFKRVRHSIPALFVISIFINIGMWFERYVIVVTSLHHEYEPFAWGIYRPSVTEMCILLGSFCWFGFWFLLFTRLLPPIAIQELKEVLPPPMRKTPKAPETAEVHA
jgi:molybdopterin-containing oxidoreductase family membrane subunit